MAIANRILLRPVIEGINEHTNTDAKYRTIAKTIIMSKFGPSGSLKDMNIVLEDAIAVNPRIINEAFFDVKCIFVIILEI